MKTVIFRSVFVVCVDWCSPGERPGETGPKVDRHVGRCISFDTRGVRADRRVVEVGLRRVPAGARGFPGLTRDKRGEPLRVIGA